MTRDLADIPADRLDAPAPWPCEAKRTIRRPVEGANLRVNFARRRESPYACCDFATLPPVPIPPVTVIGGKRIVSVWLMTATIAAVVLMGVIEIYLRVTKGK